MSEAISTSTLTTIEAFLRPAVDAGAIPRKEFQKAMERLRSDGEDAVPPVSRPRMLTKRQYADLMSVSTPTVNRWMSRGLIHFERTPSANGGYGHVRIPADEMPREPANGDGERGSK